MRRRARRVWRAADIGRRSTIEAVDIVLILVIVLIVVVIWRGPKTLPMLGKAFGQGVKEARREIDEIKGDGADDPKPPAA
jgi:Sec-independent protein translocase protein TatA